MLLSGVETLETDVTKPLSAMERFNKSTMSIVQFLEELKMGVHSFKVCGSYLNMAAVVTSVVSVAHCSGLAPC